MLWKFIRLEPLSEFAEESDESGEKLTSPRTWVAPSTIKTPLISRRENPDGVGVYNINSYKKTTACFNGKCEITICVNGECTTTNWDFEKIKFDFFNNFEPVDKLSKKSFNVIKSF